MPCTDPISDYLTRVRNSVRAQQRFVEVPWSNMNQALTEILQKEGFIQRFVMERESGVGTLRLFLKYGKGRRPIIHELQRVSRPGRRSYIKHDAIRMIHGDMGISIVSTSQGVMAGHEARERGIGGEYLCKIW